jgi:hypothetical protein
LFGFILIIAWGYEEQVVNLHTLFTNNIRLYTWIGWCYDHKTTYIIASIANSAMAMETKGKVID